MNVVIPAKAGSALQQPQAGHPATSSFEKLGPWIPAFAGMTGKSRDDEQGLSDFSTIHRAQMCSCERPVTGELLHARPVNNCERAL
jgi:hypothetical protein